MSFHISVHCFQCLYLETSTPLLLGPALMRTQENDKFWVACVVISHADMIMQIIEPALATGIEKHVGNFLSL